MKGRWRKSITLRLTLLFASISSVVFLLLGILIGNSVERHFEVQDTEILTGKLELARNELSKVRSEEELVNTLRQLDNALVGHQGLAVIILMPGSQIGYATEGADFPKRILEPAPSTETLRPVRWVTGANTPYRGLATSIRTAIDGGKQIYAVAAIDISYHEHFMDLFRRTMWSFVTLAAALTGFLGWVAVRSGMAPLHSLRRQAENITAHRLNARLEVEAIPAELQALADTLNAMLTRLEDSFRRLSDFSSDLAHELRTPISNLLTQSQVTLSKPRTAEEYQEILASNIEEYERLSRMVTDMLFLAKADDGQIIPTKETLELKRLVEDLVEFYRLIAEDKDIALSYDGDAIIRGDSLMVRRAVSNLLSNAIRHAPAGGHVTIRIASTDSSFASLSVENSGPTIPPEHLPRLFDRFYRADPSRHRLSDGAGLGLAITRSIARAHGGSVSVRSENGITVFELRFPTEERWSVES
ncbi:heavy metal sensor histidine kinase [Propionivibrio soli]|uniref:heavy metal sensor histidine kinase n=1 Tax=Propionivibrio soli TaxID=2976531 RepID=UPI0021E7C42C